MLIALTKKLLLMYSFFVRPTKKQCFLDFYSTQPGSKYAFSSLNVLVTLCQNTAVYFQNTSVLFSNGEFNYLQICHNSWILCDLSKLAKQFKILSPSNVLKSLNVVWVSKEVKIPYQGREIFPLSPLKKSHSSV